MSALGNLMTTIGNLIGWVLAGFYSIIPNYGVAIILLSVVWMALIAPLTLKQTRSMLAMQKLQPKIKELQNQHRGDRAALSQAQMDLYKQEGVSPLGGCLPAILPLPIFFLLFRVLDGLSTITKGQPTPKYLNHGTRMYKDLVHAHGVINAFGMNLAKSGVFALSHAGSLAIGTLFAYIFLLLMMIGAQYYQQVLSMSRNPAAKASPNMQMMKFVPLVFGVFCVRFPAGVVLYYFVSSLCRIGQQLAMYRFDPKVKALVTYDVGVIEARAAEIEGVKPKGRLRDLFAVPLPPADGTVGAPSGAPRKGWTPPSSPKRAANGGGARTRGSGLSKPDTKAAPGKAASRGDASKPASGNGGSRRIPNSSGGLTPNRPNRKRRGR